MIGQPMINQRQSLCHTRFGNYLTVRYPFRKISISYDSLYFYNIHFLSYKSALREINPYSPNTHFQRRIKKQKVSKSNSNSDTFCFIWRRVRDSNPRGIAPKLISSQPRYDHFDNSPSIDQTPKKRFIVYAFGTESYQSILAAGAAMTSICRPSGSSIQL